MWLPLFSEKVEPITVDDKVVLKKAVSPLHMAIYSLPQLSWQVDFPYIPGKLSTEKNLPGHFRLPGNKTTHLVLLFSKDAERLQLSEAPENLRKQRKMAIATCLCQSYFATNLPEYDKALHWAKISGQELVVTQFGKGIWAGLPWFTQNWGRDTFIALPGISLVNGQFAQAVEIIDNFVAYQMQQRENKLYGRIPNRVNSPTDIIYNTADGTPWLVREIGEYVDYSGDLAFARRLFSVIRRSIQGACANFIDDLVFLTHDDADSWMDARIDGGNAWSPRSDRAVEIQVLWYTQLKIGENLARTLNYPQQAETWGKLAAKLKQNFHRKFYCHKNYLYDHLNTDHSPDLAIRPNQIFAVTVPLGNEIIDKNIQAGIVHNVVSKLTYPYGVASLSQDDKYFHPFHHEQIYHFDAAYHNGLCWHWIAGPVITGMVRMGYADLAFQLTTNLAQQVLHRGMPGSLSELIEPIAQPNAQPKLTGAYSQAWSVSEFVRNFYQDYLGLKPRMLNREVEIAPRMPARMKRAEFLLNIGDKEQVYGNFCQTATEKQFLLRAQKLQNDLLIKLQLVDPKYCVYQAALILEKQGELCIKWPNINDMCLQVNGEKVIMQAQQHIPRPDQNLSFQIPHLQDLLPALHIPGYLRKICLGK